MSIYRQVVFYPMFKSGATYTNPDGSSWDLLDPSDADYDLQFIECFVSGCYALGRYMKRHGGVDLWFSGELSGTVSGGMGELPVLVSGGGGCLWETARAEFVQCTGEYVPSSWQDLARMWG